MKLSQWLFGSNPGLPPLPPKSFIVGEGSECSEETKKAIECLDEMESPLPHLVCSATQQLMEEAKKRTAARRLEQIPHGEATKTVEGLKAQDQPEKLPSRDNTSIRTHAIDSDWGGDEPGGEPLVQQAAMMRTTGDRNVLGEHICRLWKSSPPHVVTELAVNLCKCDPSLYELVVRRYTGGGPPWYCKPTPLEVAAYGRRVTEKMQVLPLRDTLVTGPAVKPPADDPSGSLRSIGMDFKEQAAAAAAAAAEVMSLQEILRPSVKDPSYQERSARIYAANAVTKTNGEAQSDKIVKHLLTAEAQKCGDIDEA